MFPISRRAALFGLGTVAVAPLLATPGADAAAWTMPSMASTRARFAGRTPTYWGMYAPGVVSSFSTATKLGKNAVCLTFDACGGSVTRYDADLIATLRRYQVPATLFINRQWMMNNPTIFQGLLADPLFQIENHGWAHQPLSVIGRSAYGIAGTRNIDAVWGEIATCNWYLASHWNHTSTLMRAGTCFTDDVASAAAQYMGQRLVSFSINGDGGASYPAATVYSETIKARPGDIVISHMNHPGGGTAPGYARAIPAMKARGLVFRHLRDVL